MKSTHVLSRPVISEKAFGLAEAGKYVFMVPQEATKIEIARAVREQFGVRVSSVNTFRVKGRPRRYGRITGRTKDYKKAVVTLAEGEKIQMFEEGKEK